MPPTTKSGMKSKKPATAPQDSFGVRKRQKTQPEKVAGRKLDKPSSKFPPVTPDGQGALCVRKLGPTSSPAAEVSQPAVKPEDKQKDIDYLRQFDLNYEFGPCGGITRMQRWERAEKGGRKPPQLVKDLVEAHASDPDYANELWHNTSI